MKEGETNLMQNSNEIILLTRKGIKIKVKIRIKIRTNKMKSNQTEQL